MLKFGAKKRSRDGMSRKEYGRAVDIVRDHHGEGFEDDKSIRNLLEGMHQNVN